jgi:mono/diheme cytochrome c family protein
MKHAITLILVGLAVIVSGCARNRPSEKPPIHLQQNMDEQPKYKQQAESRFFVDGASMRLPVEGTVARGWLREDSAFYAGRDGRGNLVAANPRPITPELMRRGQERFDIYCAPCHGAVGDAKSIVVKKGLLPPPSFHEQRLRDTVDGHFYDVITHGVRSMPPYKYQIRLEDRWAIVAYIRALQRSQNATINDVPEDRRSSVK